MPAGFESICPDVAFRELVRQSASLRCTVGCGQVPTAKWVPSDFLAVLFFFVIVVFISLCFETFCEILLRIIL